LTLALNSLQNLSPNRVELAQTGQANGAQFFSLIDEFRTWPLFAAAATSVGLAKMGRYHEWLSIFFAKPFTKVIH
jgi:hypothetical protein